MVRLDSFLEGMGGFRYLRMFDVPCIILKEGLIIELPSRVDVAEASIHPPQMSCTDPA
jgi:hypothetical protein